jgi:putative DNA methylase
MKQTKKLIEVALPLVAINKACVREKAIRQGHPSTLHLWWARRPLAAARAVLFAQMVDDPSAHPDLFPTEKKQEKERQRLFRIIEDLVQWENTTNEAVLEQARAEIWQSWRAACAENVDHPRAKELFNRHKLPSFHDPFAGGGSLPLEAQRFGLEAFASDLNPVAVMICKAMIEIPPRFAGRPPVNPNWQEKPKEEKVANTWRGAQGLADDVRYYGQRMRDEAEKRIGHLYPKIEITAEVVRERPDLKPLLGQKLTVIAWLWARTVKSPNPAFSDVSVPLASSFMLSTKEGKEAYIQPIIEGGGYRFTVRMGKPKDEEAAKNGTKLARANFACLLSGAPISAEYIKDQGKTGQMGVRLMAIVADGPRGRVYLDPTREQEAASQEAKPAWRPEGEIATRMTGGNCTPYGLTSWGHLFTDRQLVALRSLSDLVQEARSWAKQDALVAQLSDDDKRLEDGGAGATAYSDAMALYLGLAVSRTTNTINALVVWSQSREQSVNLFSRQAIPMAWDFPEVNPFGGAAGDFGATTASVGKTISAAIGREAHVFQRDAQTQNLSESKVVSTDPPYYDNIGYADLSDFFYVWLRCSLKSVFPDLFSHTRRSKGRGTGGHAVPPRQ